MIPASIDEALDFDNMPDGKDWMRIAPDIVSYLTHYELYRVLTLLTSGGQTEVDKFYNALSSACKELRVLELIALAKKED